MREISHSAMIENNAAFVQTLLDNGLKFSEIVSNNGLYELYNQVITCTTVLGRIGNHLTRG